MKTRNTKIVSIVLIAIGAVGCQSGPRWAQAPSRLAWWKKDAPAADSSLVARSAEGGVEVPDPTAPVLPSTVATPQTLAAASMPPSANSVGAAPAVSSIPATSAATIAAAPTATYPTSTPTPIVSPNSATPPPPATLPSAIAQVGPYDPKAFQTATVAQSENSFSNPSASDEDRYGLAASDRYAAAPVTAVAPTTRASNAAPGTTAAEASASSDDRYAYNPPSTMPGYATSSGGDRYSVTPVAPAAMPVTNSTVPTAAPVAVPVTVPIGPQSSTQSAAADIVAAATVRIEGAAGQYRPGGTSTYTGTLPTPIEVAARPSAPATTSAPLPTSFPTVPAGTSSSQRY